MATLSMFLDMVDRLRDFLVRRADQLAAERERLDAVLGVVNRAANRTRGYLADLRQNPEARDREREMALSDAWVEVGESLLRIDDPGAEDLYERCFMKARYWSDPDSYDSHGTGDTDIRLEAVLGDVETVCRRQQGS